MAHGRDTHKGWSTRELAEMVDTTVKTIRHYHRVGLLEEPERRPNGYKAYGPEHVAQLLEVLRLREIGLSVAQIGEAMGSSEGSVLDAEDLIAEIDSSIRRLQAIRRDLEDSLDSDGTWRLSPSFAGGVKRPGDAERLVQHLMARHFTREAMAALGSLDGAPSPVDAEFEQLPADSGDDEISDLAARMAPHIRRAQAEYSMPEHVVASDGDAGGRAALAIGRMLSELYNPAQLEVVTRALDEGTRSDSASG